MKLLRYIIIAGLVICSVAAVSCKKDKKGSTSTKAYLSGGFSLDIPSYVNRGDVFHIDPYGVYMGETADSLVGYRWTDPFTSKSDTLRYEDEPASVGKAFDFVIPDDADLKTFTLSVAAFAEGYYDKNATATFTVVDSTPETGSLSGWPITAPQAALIFSAATRRKKRPTAALHTRSIPGCRRAPDRRCSRSPRRPDLMPPPRR